MFNKVLKAKCWRKVMSTGVNRDALRDEAQCRDLLIHGVIECSGAIEPIKNVEPLWLRTEFVVCFTSLISQFRSCLRKQDESRHRTPTQPSFWAAEVVPIWAGSRGWNRDWSGFCEVTSIYCIKSSISNQYAVPIAAASYRFIRCRCPLLQGISSPICCNHQQVNGVKNKWGDIVLALQHWRTLNDSSRLRSEISQCRGGLLSLADNQVLLWSLTTE